MSNEAKLYVACVISAGLAVLGWAARLFHADMARFAVLAVTVLITSSFKIRIPRTKGTFSANSVVIVLTVAAGSMPESILLALLGAMVQTCWRAKEKPALVQTVFNMANLAVSVSAAHSCAYAFGWRLPGAPALFVVLAASMVYFMVNTLLVSGIIARIGGQSTWSVWRQWHMGAFPYFTAAATVAGMMTITVPHGPLYQWALIIPAMYLAYRYFKPRLEFNSAA